MSQLALKPPVLPVVLSFNHEDSSVRPPIMHRTTKFQPNRECLAELLLSQKFSRHFEADPNQPLDLRGEWTECVKCRRSFKFPICHFVSKRGRWLKGEWRCNL